MSYAKGSADCTRTLGTETQERHPRSVSETEAVLFPCTNPSAFLSSQTCLFFFSFLVLCSFEYMRKKSGRQEER